ncbi:hypothetical protein KBA63_00580 [Candidatus Woesebacteria bacterium]|nr:hypothetical protein [Candidatus Woesebacteria bacterium]
MIQLKFPALYEGDLVSLSDLRVVLDIPIYKWENRMLLYLYGSDEYLTDNKIKVVHGESGQTHMIVPNEPGSTVLLKSEFPKNPILVEKHLAEMIIRARNAGVHLFQKTLTRNNIPISSWNTALISEDEGVRTYACAVGYSFTGRRINNPEYRSDPLRLTFK